MAHFWYQAETFDGGSLGQVAVAGSGSQAVRECAAMINSGDFPVTHQAGVGPIAATAGLSIAAALLRSELHGGDAAPTLRHMFGGGYEVACFLDGEFRKLGNLTFVIWQAEVTDDGTSLSHPQLLLKQEYFHDILLMRSARIGIKAIDNKLELIDQQFHSVLPMYDISEDVGQEEMLKLSLQSDFTCHCIFVKEKGNLAYLFYIDRCSPGGDPTMVVEELAGTVNIKFSSKFINQIFASLRD